MQQVVSERFSTGVVQSIFQDHAGPWQRLGYSAKEVFWLNFACIPLLPWADETEQEVRLSDLFDCLLHIYQIQVEALSEENRVRLSQLLRQRYLKIAQVTRRPESTQTGQDRQTDKWSTAALLIQQIAHTWQRGPALPYRLVEDI